MKIYNPIGRAEEYSPLALNYFSGCTHNCRYCYVNRLNLISGEQQTQAICSPPTPNGYKELEISAKRFQGCNKQILLSFTGDPYCNMPQHYTRQVLEILNKYEHKVCILTKGGSRTLRDIDLFKKFVTNDLFTDSAPRISVGATLTFDNPEDSLKWEPGAALPADRIESLRILSEQGIRTWVSFEPVICPEQTLNLLNQVSNIVHHVRIGKINDYCDLDKNIDWNDFIKQAVGICRDKQLPFYIKNDLAAYNKNTFLFDTERNHEFLNL
ncbi:MAG: hypothetical protein VB102_00500 [Paludibacter sp.]|nr:hypothetical protein [Paludibacter sp.]